jgi:antagonist of KipI
VTPQSNRMGYRLGGVLLQTSSRAEMLSEATPVGSLQVTGSGQPILLMADRQTTGGYPGIATVISADLPFAGQLAPGDWIEFEPCTRAVAIDALRQQEAALAGASR